VTGEERYATDAIRRVDAWVTAEEGRIAANQRAQVAADSYLHVGSIVGDLALTYDWCHDRLTESQRSRWLAYAQQAVWNVWNHTLAQWGSASFPWSGWSVDNPSNNYYYSFLEATVLFGLAAKGEHPAAEGWVRHFREAKIGQQLVPAFVRDLAGGGSREGTGYGIAMRDLFKLYDVWEATTGERLADLAPHTRDSLAYLLHATVPTLDRIAPIGDHSRDSTAALFDYHRSYVQVLARLFRADPLAAIARTYLARCSVPRMTQGFMFLDDYLYDEPGAAERPLSELGAAYYGVGTGHLFARTDWSTSATWVGFIAGPFTESHAHADQLSFLVYKDEWLAYDANVHSHSGIRAELELHNLVRLERSGRTVPMVRGPRCTPRETKSCRIAHRPGSP
jgi:hypothetical protein